MTDGGQSQRRRNADCRWNAFQLGCAVERCVLTSVYGVEAGDLCEDRAAKPQRWQDVSRIREQELAADRNPDANGRQHERCAEPEVGEGREPLRKAIGEQKEQHW